MIMSKRDTATDQTHSNHRSLSPGTQRTELEGWHYSEIADTSDPRRCHQCEFVLSKRGDVDVE